jgi:hypothetical protein
MTNSINKEHRFEPIEIPDWLLHSTMKKSFDKRNRARRRKVFIGGVVIGAVLTSLLLGLVFIASLGVRFVGEHACLVEYSQGKHSEGCYNKGIGVEIINQSLIQ